MSLVPALRPVRAALALILAASTSVCFGSSPAIPDDKAVARRRADYVSFTAISENDLYTVGTESDRYYTTGQKLTIISDRMSSFGEAFAFLPAKILAEFASPPRTPAAAPGLPIEPTPPPPEPTQLRVASSLGQNMFTPADLHTPVLQADDRPYAAWLYLSFALQARSTAAGPRAHLSVWGVDVGLVGPDALGKTIQDFVHDRISHSPRAQGWHHQLRNEPGLNLYHQTKLRRTLGDRRTLAAEVIGHAGFSLGNVATYANTGAALRLGFGLPDDFGTDIIRSGADTTQAGGRPPTAWGLHLFGGFDARLVGRDIFLNGNTLTRSHRIAHEVFVGDFQFGLTLNYRRCTIAFSQVRRSPEFKLQGHTQAYGSLTLTIPISARTSR